MRGGATMGMGFPGAGVSSANLKATSLTFLALPFLAVHLYTARVRNCFSLQRLAHHRASIADGDVDAVLPRHPVREPAGSPRRQRVRAATSQSKLSEVLHPQRLVYRESKCAGKRLTHGQEPQRSAG